MEFNFIEGKDSRNLVKNLFKLTFSKNDLPFESIILPLGFPSLAYIFSNTQEIDFKGKKSSIKGSVITGQFYGTYDFSVKDESTNIGIILHPTSLYKIFKTDISFLTNKITPIEEFNLKISKELSSIFLNNKDELLNYEKEMLIFIESLNIKTDSEVKQIDKAINLIIEKDGLIQVNELLNVISFSQKSLETKFKKIVGLTPGKFIRQYRFMNLMQKYQSKKIALTDLIYMFDYYDQSHFAKDFKFFMKQSPKKFFKNDYPLLEKYLIE
ncbi:helix-turn-helix domain-containing protein [Polaribacter ponticola]|uniref:Helix-turn-helix domain-containing protein n=1 Tax=Polaribacter ponticola TaxID=2978475 RepID=A0ABT5SCU4_9FLAO|nr:helix-turn-helix domain-containing protein [Polaribacter sp. MSW5]MDD7915953.1 helix-turn-helix domain-containing protein [Polaribacter sp. MSW5]